MTTLRQAITLATLLGCSPSSSTPVRDADAGDSSGPIALDTDGDGISDAAEGEADTDGDGTPDLRDEDSDNDGIPDSVERGPSTVPADADGDGVPNFRDTDSDGNGVLDSEDGTGDNDGDGIPDAIDRDDDNDGIYDAVEYDNLHDSDADGMPDYRDSDSDNDTIGDRDESTVDSDLDGTPDRFDADSDNDGLGDSDEAGDADIATPAVDTDEDTIANFRDPDSDSDGLSDSNERQRGTSPILADTDADGVTDLVEVGACPANDATCMNDATNASSSPRTRGDFVFFMPFEQDPTPMRDTLSFSTTLRMADVYFLVDTTASMQGAIDNVRTSLSRTGGIIDQVRATIPNVAFGVGEYRDSGDAFIYRNQQDLTDNAAAAQTAVGRLAAGGGGNIQEGGIAALYATVTGRAIPRTPARTCGAGLWGGACFREGAVPIVVTITDAPLTNGPSGRYATSDYLDYTALRPFLLERNVRVLGVAVSGGLFAEDPIPDLEPIARDTGAVSGTGAALVSRTASGDVSTSIVDHIRTLANSSLIDINVVVEDDPSDTVDVRAAFVDYVEPNTSGATVMTRVCTAFPGDRMSDADADGHNDTIRGVTPGQPVCFDIVAQRNATVMPTTSPQLFRGVLRVMGDGFTELDSREVFFLVPPRIEIPTVPLG